MTLRAHTSTRVHNTRLAFSLVESIVCVVLVGGLLVAALYAVGDATIAQARTTDRARGSLLAHELMAEILARPYEDPQGEPAPGREADETATNRSDFDDVDDYHTWDASPPQQRDGTVLADLTGWRRTVAVRFAQRGDPSVQAFTNTGVKRVTVTASLNGVPMATLAAVRTRGADKVRGR